MFLDCLTCDQEFLRAEITYVDFVRDRRDARVHVLVTSQAAGGGTEFTLAFIGQEESTATNLTLRYVSSQTDTADEVRRAIARRLELGLAPYLAGTPLADHVEITRVGAATEPSVRSRPEHDPWRFWVFRTSASATLDREQSQRSFSASGALSADRTTEAWKVRLNARSSYRNDEFDFENSERFTNTTRNWDSTMLAVRSVGDHWGVGMGGSAVSSTFLNQDRTFRLAPAVEFNVFPYAQSTRRQLTFTYSIGANHFDYEERTIFDKTSELLTDQTATVSLNLRQPWGSTSVSVEGAQFLEDPQKFRIVGFADVEFRVFRGFSLEVIGSTSIIRDQVFLPRGRASPEEVLVRRRQLATGFAHSLFLGVSYTFGSIFNNVVNSRFAGSSGGVVRRF